jgi:hypothetical protein
LLKIACSDGEDYLQSDLFIFSYIISEFERGNRTAEAINSVLRVLLRARPGSTLLVIDNGSSAFFNPLLSLMPQYGGEILVDASATRDFSLDQAEKTAVRAAIQPWINYIDWTPRWRRCVPALTIRTSVRTAHCSD